MPDVPAGLRLTVAEVRSPARPSAPPPVGSPWLFAFWMAAAAAVAVLAGLVLGILAATESSIGGTRWTPSVQAHGRLQLFGFVAPFVVALAFEFIPRLLGRAPFSARARLLVPAALVAGAALLAAGQLWDAEAGFLVWPGGALFLAGSLAFAFLVWRVPLRHPLAADPQPLFLRGAAAWLAVAAALTVWATARANAGVVELADSRTVVETFLRGFVMSMIIGIALRAFVGHLALVPLGARKQAVVLLLLNASLVVWLAGQGFGRLPSSAALSRLGDAGFGAGILLFTFWFGVLARLRRPSLNPRYVLLIPIAWAGGAVYAAWLVAAAIFAAPGDLSLYQEGAIRHTFLLGFMIPLMVAMAHVVLARFATGAVPWEPALTLAFVLLWIAWPLRIVPVITNRAPTPTGEALFAAAGLLAMAGLALVAIVAARTAVLVARRHRSLTAAQRPALVVLRD
jgi:hypothetical protein